MLNMRRLDEEINELMGPDVSTIRGTSACTSGMESVREATASVALRVKPVTAEMRRVTLKRSSISLESKEIKKRKSREH